MGQALYRAYRPKSLGEIVGQEHVTTTLSNALKSGKISHAYLLTGPRGTGKTSIARILAHEINDLPYDDEAHLDIIEIDAASNRRIDEIRDLRDRVSTAPSAAKYKVYIIDEVHMLTKEAFNALLKTLEEPPAHVVFILATTEAHKLPETITSRTQRYSFRPVPSEQAIGLLQTIAKKEKIIIDDEALALIAEHGEGSLRDSVSLLDQASNLTDKVTKIDIEQMLGLAPAEQITTLLQSLESSDSSQLVQTLASIYLSGYEPARIASQLAEQLRSQLLAGTLSVNLQAGEALALLKRLLDVPAARNPKQLLELVLLQTTVASIPIIPREVVAAAPMVNAAVNQPLPRILEPAPSLGPVPAPAAAHMAIEGPKPIVEKPVPDTPDKKTASKPITTEPARKPVEGALSDVDLKDYWQQTLNEIKKQYNTLYGIARMASIELDGDKLTLSLKFAFHQKRINEAKNRKILGDVMSELLGRHIEIFCVVAEKPLPPTTGTSTTAGPDVSAISNIFGSAELLES